jgi:hypothetical protein
MNFDLNPGPGPPGPAAAQAWFEIKMQKGGNILL